MNAVATDKYLHERRAWNWAWPNENNTWPGTKRRKPKGKPGRYTGPSKRTLAKRAAKAAQKRK